MTLASTARAPLEARRPWLDRFDGRAWIGLGLTIIAALIYWFSNREFDARHGDFFYLADAFLHGRTWIDYSAVPRGGIGFQDLIPIGDRFYVPFGPFPAFVLMPIVAIIGPVTADQWESGINATLAAIVVGLAWWLLGRIGVRRLLDRFLLVALLGFSTQIWWITTRGGVWHTGQLIATSLTLLCMIELTRERPRALLIGLLAGFAFLSRAPVAFAFPAYALLVAGDRIWEPRKWPWRAWFELTVGVLPSIAFFFWYNLARFGSPLESGYALAALPAWLQAQRDLGLFSTAHIGMNVEYLFLRLPEPVRSLTELEFPFFRPSGLGMSIFFTSPGLLYALRAPWRASRSWWLLLAALIILIPTLLYYGGGWLQYGFRYALDSIPFIWLLCGLAAVKDDDEGDGMGWTWRFLIAFGVAVGAMGVYWAYNLF
ncbi:MAG TPA: hypothetical protein VM427_03120 [Patescibacteria group bacterium]|nr:hypothetical protein [Patescibacteria group bacterium]